MTGAIASLIAESIARLFANVGDEARLRVEAGDFDQGLWSEVVEGGFHSLMVAESAGGFGLGWADAYPVLRGIGFWQVPLPLAETIIASLLASLAGFENSDLPMTIAEQDAGDELSLTGARLSGTIRNVPWARHSDSAMIALSSGQMAHVALRETPGVSIHHHHNYAGLPVDTVVLDNVSLLGLAPNPVLLTTPVRTLGALARSAMIVGALESALEQSVRYAGERVQFGKPIGKYQAIQHSLALMASDLAAARVATLTACGDAPDASGGNYDAASFSIAVAKIRTSEAATRGVMIAHQVHGAIGFTHEHSLHFATRRLLAWRNEFGTDATWALELGRFAILGRGAQFWPALTSKTLMPNGRADPQRPQATDHS